MTLTPHHCNGRNGCSLVLRPYNWSHEQAELKAHTIDWPNRQRVWRPTRPACLKHVGVHTCNLQHLRHWLSELKLKLYIVMCPMFICIRRTAALDSHTGWQAVGPPTTTTSTIGSARLPGEAECILGNKALLTLGLFPGQSSVWGCRIYLISPSTDGRKIEITDEIGLWEGDGRT